MGKYVLKRSSDGQYHWTLKAANGEVILNSETYKTKASAENGIDSCRKNSPHDEQYSRLTATNGQLYFTLRAGNYEVIGTSETYTSQQGRETGIQSCKTNGPTSPVVDLTAQRAGVY